MTISGLSFHDLYFKSQSDLYLAEIAENSAKLAILGAPKGENCSYLLLRRGGWRPFALFALETGTFFSCLRWTLLTALRACHGLTAPVFFAEVDASPLLRFPLVARTSNANRIAAGLTSSSESKSERTYSSGAGGELTVRVARLGPGVVAMLAA